MPNITSSRTKKSTVKLFSLVYLYLFYIVLAAALILPVTGAYAQNTGWSYPEVMPSLDLNITPPILVADQDGTLHAFSSQFIETPNGNARVVIYNKWTLETGWTLPVDILLSPFKEARVTDVYLDQEGFFNLVFFGGDETGADIFYSKVPHDEVANARFWMEPIIIGEQAANPEGAVFAQNAHGELIVLFYGRQFGNGLYVVKSDDNGDTWSFPTPIYIASEDTPYIFNIHVVNSKTGWLHVIWNVNSLGGQGRGIYYTRSVDGEIWDQPVVLAEAKEGLGPTTPTIIEHNEELIALYNLPPKIIMQRSVDNGISWQDPAIIFSRHVGVNGSLAPVVDGNNTLHLFFGQRISGSPDIHGMWHSVWENNRWVEPEAVIRGPRILDTTGYTGFDPYNARAISVQGNLLMVMWNTDPGNEMIQNGAWYSYKILNLPDASTTLLPAIQSSEAPLNNRSTPFPEATSPSPLPLYTDDHMVGQTNDIEPEGTRLPNIFLYSIISLILLIILIFNSQVFRRKRQK